MFLRVLFSVYTAISLVASAADVDSAKISRLVKQLKPYVYGISGNSKVKGDSAEAMLRDYALRINKVEKSELSIVNYPDKLPEVDESTNQYGLCKLVDARDLALSEVEANDDGGKENAKEVRAKVHGIFWDLKTAGAKFGYTSDGGSACGVTWPSPLIIDTEAGKIYELLLAGGPC